MTLEQFITENLWGIIVGGLGLIIQATLFWAAMRYLTKKVERLSKTVYGEIVPAINDIKVKQAERIGYERAMAEFKEQMKGAH